MQALSGLASMVVLCDAGQRRTGPGEPARSKRYQGINAILALAQISTFPRGRKGFPSPARKKVSLSTGRPPHSTAASTTLAPGDRADLQLQCRRGSGRPPIAPRLPMRR
jgi:hypothetical protein